MVGRSLGLPFGGRPCGQGMLKLCEHVADGFDEFAEGTAAKVGAGELDALHEHAARTARGVEGAFDAWTVAGLAADFSDRRYASNHVSHTPDSISNRFTRKQKRFIREV